MASIALTDRTTISLTGAETEALLQRLITTDMEDVVTDHAGYGALLAPQGKILFDFLIIRRPDHFLVDIAAHAAADFIKKMTLYRLRADIAITQLDSPVIWTDQAQDGAVKDPRANSLGWRLYGDDASAHSAEQSSSENDQTGPLAKLFIDASIPRAGLDFELGDAFPHDVNMEDLGGLDFEKGCYVGQEVVSRMQHRGTARRRLVALATKDGTPMPQTGSTLTAEGKAVGTLGAIHGTQGLAIIRLDRLADAVREGQDLMVGETPLQAQIPAYATFQMPE